MTETNKTAVSKSTFFQKEVLDFIQEIEEKSAIWKRGGKKKQKLESWQSIADMFNLPVDEAKKKWSKIRNAFNRCLNKVPTNADNNKYICHPKFLNSKWPYYHSMMFMVDEDRIDFGKRKFEHEEEEIETKRRRTQTDDRNDGPSSILSSYYANNMNIDENDTYTNQVPSNNDMNPTQEMSLNTALFDTDYLFLLSVYPLFKGLTVEQKINVRLFILNKLKETIEPNVAVNV